MYEQLCPSKNFNIEKCWDSVVFAFIFLNLAMLQNFSMFQTFSMFQKNLEKVWDIEKCLYLCFLLIQISKKQGKNDRVPTFFYVFFRKKVWDIEKSQDSVIFLLHFSDTPIIYVFNTLQIDVKQHKLRIYSKREKIGWQGRSYLRVQLNSCKNHRERRPEA